MLISCKGLKATIRRISETWRIGILQLCCNQWIYQGMAQEVRPQGFRLLHPRTQSTSTAMDTSTESSNVLLPMARAGLSSCNALHSINFRGFQHETFSFYRLLSASISFQLLSATRIMIAKKAIPQGELLFQDCMFQSCEVPTMISTRYHHDAPMTYNMTHTHTQNYTDGRRDGATVAASR